MDRRSIFGLIGALLVLVIWGLNYTVVKYALLEIPPLALAAVRILSATVILGLVCTTRWQDRKKTASIGKLAALGFIGLGSNQLLFVLGIARTTPAHSALMIGMVPAFVSVLASFFLRERLKTLGWIGLAAGFLGIYIVATQKGLSLDSSYLTGDLLTVAAGLFFAGYTVFGKEAVTGADILWTTFLVYFFASLLIVPFGARQAVTVEWGEISVRGYLSLSYVIVFTSVIAYFLYYWSLDRMEATRLGVMNYLQPVFATFFSVVLYGETLAWSFLFGAVLIFAGVSLTGRGTRREVKEFVKAAEG
jgi:drug/metabolite transporter (DMT)-like permease